MQRFEHPWLDGEPSLEEALSDPIVHLVMQRDGLTLEAVRTQIDASILRLRHDRSLSPRAA